MNFSLLKLLIIWKKIFDEYQTYVGLTLSQFEFQDLFLDILVKIIIFLTKN